MSLPHVLLGLLAHAPASGWDLRRRLETEPELAWDAALAQIYPALKRLLRGGFVAARRCRPERGPARREYRITTLGRRELHAWLSEPIDRLSRAHDPLLTRLAFLERLPIDRRVERLKGYEALVAEELTRTPASPSAVGRRRRVLLETELAWIESELFSLRRRWPRHTAQEPAREARGDRARD